AGLQFKSERSDVRVDPEIFGDGMTTGRGDLDFNAPGTQLQLELGIDEPDTGLDEVLVTRRSRNFRVAELLEEHLINPRRQVGEHGRLKGAALGERCGFRRFGGGYRVDSEHFDPTGGVSGAEDAAECFHGHGFGWGQVLPWQRARQELAVSLLIA